MTIKTKTTENIFVILAYMFLAFTFPKTWPEWLISAITGAVAVSFYFLRENQKLKEERKELLVRIGELDNKTQYSTTRNSVLKNKTLRTVRRLREYLEKRNINEYRLITFTRIYLEAQQKLESTQGQENNQDITITEIVKEILSKSIACMGKEISEDMAYFNENFRAETLLLKQELEGRLTDSKGASIELYEHPIMKYTVRSIGTNFITEIADDLEYLAHQLN